MAKTQILEYTIGLPDQALVDSLNAQLDAGTGPGLLVRYYSPAAQGLVYGVLRAPYNPGPPEGGAAVEFADEANIYPPALPVRYQSDPASGPCIRSPWFTSGGNFPLDVATFTRKSGGWFGIPSLFGQTTTFKWAGRFVYARVGDDPTPEPSPDTLEPSVPAPPSARRFINGFEITGGGERCGLTGSSGNTHSRDSSRVVGGLGFALRDFAQERWSYVLPDIQTSILGEAACDPGGTVDSYFSQSWERFRLRVRKLPTIASPIWFGENFASSGTGIRIYVTPSGGLAFYHSTGGAAGDADLISVNGSLTVGEWVRVDLLISTTSKDYQGTNCPPDERKMRVVCYLNGVALVTVEVNFTGGLIPNVRHVGSELGRTHAIGDGEFDFDDWINAAWPWVGRDNLNLGARAWIAGSDSAVVGDIVAISNGRVYQCIQNTSEDPPNVTFWKRLTASLDWLHGSHIALVRPTGFDAAHANWTGDWRAVSAVPFDNTGASTALLPEEFVSTTSGAVAAFSTDAATPRQPRGILGAAAIAVGIYGHRGTTDGTVGTKLNGAAAVDTAIVQSASPNPNWNSVLRQLTPAAGVGGLIGIDSLVLRHVKGADASQGDLRSLLAAVEFIGTFGQEDNIAPADLGIPIAAPHNTPYADSPWVTATPALCPVVIHGGTYVGNGTGFDLVFRVPVHFLWIRRVTGTGDTGTRWFSSMLASHEDRDQGLAPGRLPTAVVVRLSTPAEDEQETECRIRIAGSNAQVNGAGVTYQYIAFCDPGARFIRCGHVSHEDVTFPITEGIDDPQFTPIAGFLWPEVLANTSTDVLRYKGPAHAADAAQLVGGSSAVETAFATFLQGNLKAFSAAFPSAAGTTSLGYALFRLDDGHGTLPVWQHTSYTGDGASPRVIALTPTSGKRPLFALVQGPSASTRGYTKDPSNASGNATQISSGTENANGITAGAVDSITVGANLNASGVEYHVFVLPGSASGGADGWSVNGEFVPVEPDSPTDPGWQAPVEIDPEAPDPGGGGGDTPGEGDGPTLTPLDLDDDLADAACVTPTTRLVNLALQRIGVNTPIGTLASEVSAEAEAVRLAYDETLQETLARLPWPFATRYVTLSLQVGSAATPANAEWQYAYRIPNDCIFPRRIVTARGKAVDPTPPPFREAQGVLFTNQANAVLEYTARVACPARNGDATFRSAWAWRLAAEVAPPITRMADRAAHCLEMWEFTIETARHVLRLGNPGLRPAADPNDPDLQSQTAKLQAINTALLRIGAQTIADLTTEQSREAVGALLLYEDELRATLRDFPWSFATRYATPALVDGALDDHAAPDWIFAYRAPASMLFARRIVKPLATTGVGRGFDRTPPPYRVGSDDTGLLIYTNEPSAVLEFTIRPANVLAIGDALFRDAFSWRLAAALAPALAVPDAEDEEQTGKAPKVDRKDPRPSEGGRVRLQQLRMERARWAWAKYLEALAVARASNANEAQPEERGDADWIRDRN